MGRRILRSLRRSHYKPPDIKVEEEYDSSSPALETVFVKMNEKCEFDKVTDEATVSSSSPALQTVFVKTDEKCVIDRAPHGATVSTRDSKKQTSRQPYMPPPNWSEDSWSNSYKTPPTWSEETWSDSDKDEKADTPAKKHPQRQVYLPPKIWTEKFDSDSDNDIQWKGCLQLPIGDSSRAREEERDVETNINRADQTRVTPASGFCRFFEQCTFGHINDNRVDTEEEPVRDWVGFLEEQATMLSKPKNWTTDKEPSSPKTTVTHVLTDSVSESGEDEGEGVEQTLDDLNSLVWTATDKDVDRFVDIQILKKKRNKTRSVLIRRIREAGNVKHRKGKELWHKMASDETDDRPFRPLEGTSRTVDTTIISIRHEIPEMESMDKGWTGERPFVRNHERSSMTEPVADDAGSPNNERSVVTTSMINDYFSPNGEHSIETTSATDDSASPFDESPLVNSLQDTSSKQYPKNNKEEQLQSENFLENELPSEPILRKPSVYVTLCKAGTDKGSDNDDDYAEKDAPKEKPAAHESMLSRVLETIENGVNLLSFPEIPTPRKRKPGKRVRFAPDVKFNDTFDDYAYALDYSYSEPEFDDEESFDETYYVAEVDEVDDDEAFFDETPPIKAKSTETQKERERKDRFHTMEDDESVSDVASFEEEKSAPKATSAMTTLIEEHRKNCEDVNTCEDDDIFDFGDSSSLVIGQVSTKTGFGYLSSQTVEDDEDGSGDGDSFEESDESSVDEPFSSYRTIENLRLAKAASPFEPSMEIIESLELSSTADNWSDWSEHSESECEDHVDTETDLEADYTREPEPSVDKSSLSYETIEEMKSTTAASCSEPSIEDIESVGPLTVADSGNLHQMRRKESAEIDAIVMAVDERNFTLDVDAQSEITMKIALLERYLDISPMDTGNSAETRDTTPAIENALSTEKSSQKVAGESEAHSSVQNEEDSLQYCVTENDKFVSERPESTVCFTQPPCLEKEVDCSVTEKVRTKSATGRVDEEREDFTDWLNPPEIRESQPAPQSFSEKNAFAREEWPSLPSEWRTDNEADGSTDTLQRPEIRHDPSSCNEFIKNDEAEAEFVPQPTRRGRKFEHKIIDKRESLQLSLQGFARAKNTANWANFDNTPFRDLEIAPFDEC